MNRRAAAVGLLVLVAAFSGHAAFLLWRDHHVAGEWVTLAGRAPVSAWRQYLERHDYYVGYSYALAAGFTAFALTLSLQRRRRALGGVAGGFTLMGLLYGAGCFLIGCCGSPMLGIYLSLFGAKVLGFLKPLMAAGPTASVLTSGVLIVRRARTTCCDACAPSGDRLPTKVAATPGIPEPTVGPSLGP